MKLSPNSVKQKLECEKVCFIDVRTEDEFNSGHVPGAVCVPLDLIERGITQIPHDRPVILSCQSGRRSAQAREILQSRGMQNIAEMEGGFVAWMQSGLPVNKTRKAIPIIRQVMITAGSFVLLGIALGVVVNPLFFAIPALFGAGLTFAGVSGWCGLAFVLERMPWNKRSYCSIKFHRL